MTSESTQVLHIAQNNNYSHAFEADRVYSVVDSMKQRCPTNITLTKGVAIQILEEIKAETDDCAFWLRPAVHIPALIGAVGVSGLVLFQPYSFVVRLLASVSMVSFIQSIRRIPIDNVLSEIYAKKSQELAKYLGILKTSPKELIVELN